MRPIDITGKRFGKLVVLKKSDLRNSSNDILWECFCDCGNKKLVISGALRHGMTKSCGCMMGNPIHGDWNKRIRRTWVNMLRRCEDTKDKQFSYYGGRGISVCEEWHDYVVFKTWAYENGYDDKLTLDRKNTNDGYCPNNCRWATYTQQANNKRNNKILTVNNKSQTIADWSREVGINQIRIARRIRDGWTAEQALFTPIDFNKISKIYRKNVD